MAAADAAIVGGVELEGGIVAGDEGGEAGTDRSAAEQGDFGDAALAEPFVPLGDEAELLVGAFDEGLVAEGDDRGGDRKGVELALADRLEQGAELLRDLRRHPVDEGGDRRLFRARARFRALHGRGNRQTGLTGRLESIAGNPQMPAPGQNF